MVEVETSEALTQDISPEARSHQCGRAESLTDFRYSLILLDANCLIIYLITPIFPKI